MLIDTDVLIWNLLGNERAASLLDANAPFSISAVSYMELLPGLRDPDELRVLRRAIRFWKADIVHVDADISSRAAFLFETYVRSHSMQVADALIAATALSLGTTLVTADDRHCRHIEGLDLRVFQP